MNMKVPFALPDCGEDEIREVVEVIRSGWLTTGARASRFEKEFAEYIGVKHCLAVNSCTAALHLGLEAMGVGLENKVIVPVHTFTATAEVVRYLGADPMFVDCDRKTFCISVDGIEEIINKYGSVWNESEFKAIIPVHFGGHPCDMMEIMNIIDGTRIRVLEDAAHAFPAFCQYPNEKEYKPERRIIGTIGDVSCYSFYANKTITTAEGGMLATNEDNLAKRVETMRLHGIDRDIWKRFNDINADWAYDVVAPGFKYNMPDLSAALGIHQLRKAEQFRARRQMIAETYYRELSDVPGLILPQLKCSMEDHAWHLFVLLVEQRESPSGINRDKFIQEMRKKNIGTSVHYIPLHHMTYYRDRYGLKPEMFPNSEWVFQRCVSLPIYSAMTAEQLEYVIDSIKIIMLS
jgi:dTDP-4-amino-4,6-dideoxygalactose transaminase